MRKIRTKVADAESLAKKMASTIKGGEVFALIGELGSGKTTFTKFLGKALGIRNNITSPTFVIMQEYPVSLYNRTPKKGYFYHLDVYRLNSNKDIDALGLNQIWNQKDNIVVIEWADKIEKLLPPNTTYIYFEPNDSAAVQI